MPEFGGEMGVRSWLFAPGDSGMLDRPHPARAAALLAAG